MALDDKNRRLCKELYFLNLFLILEAAAMVIYLLREQKVFPDGFTILSIFIIFELPIVLYTLIRAYFKADVRSHIMASVLILFMGPFGLLISIVCNLFYIIFLRKFTSNFSDWLFEYLFEMDEKETDGDRIYNRIISGQEVFFNNIDTEPLIDVMEFGTSDQKQAALIKIIKYFSPQFAPILNIALNDPDNAIRVQAAAGLARLQDDFNQTYTAYEKKVIDNSATSEELVKFAKICEMYSRSKLLDPERTAAAVRKSVMMYENALEQMSDNIELKISYIRILMINREMDKAEKALNEVLPMLKKPSISDLETVTDLLLRLKRYNDLRQFTSELAKYDEAEPINDRLCLWDGRFNPRELEWGTQ